MLVAALGLAVAFVALALVLNAVVFTENLATRNHDRADDAVGFENAVEGGVGGLLAEVNHFENANYASLVVALRDGVAGWDRNATRLSVAGGRVTNATLVGVENGTQVLQSERRQFTAGNGDGSWTVAPNVNETRRFKAVVTPDSGGTFTVTVSNGTASWRVDVVDNGSSTDVVVFDDGTQVASYTRPSEAVAVDYTQGLVNGTAVANWTFAGGVGAPYDVSFANGASAEGRYVLLVDRPQSALLNAVAAGTYEDRDSGDWPTTVPAVYSANVSVTFRSAQVTYETTAHVEPRSPPAGEDYAVADDDDVPGGGTRFDRGVVFVDDDTGHLMHVTPSSNTTFAATDVEVLGPMTRDFDGDGRLEVPYVNSSNALKLIDATNGTETWRTSADAHPPTGPPSLLGLGEWNGTSYGVLYAGTSASHVYAATNATGPSVRLHHGDSGVGSVAGVADVDGDGADELVFGDTSQQLRYVDGDGTEVKISSGGFGKNNAVGVGQPADFDGDGTARVPFVDGSNNLKLVDAAGNAETIVDSANQSVDKAPVAVDDWDGDGALEVVFVSNGELWYADDVASGGTPVKITADLDGDGDSGVDVDRGPGVA